ncbi:MAG: hypothetical protein ACO3P1_14760 [Pseudomonadales bacterium]
MLTCHSGPFNPHAQRTVSDLTEETAVAFANRPRVTGLRPSADSVGAWVLAFDSGAEIVFIADAAGVQIARQVGARRPAPFGA